MSVVDQPTGADGWHWPTFVAAMLFASVVLMGATSARSDDSRGADKPSASHSTAEAVDLICLTGKRPLVAHLHITVDGRPVTEFQAATARRLFDVFDTDKNGLLEGKELESLPTPQMVAAAAREPGTSPDSLPAGAPLVSVGGKVTPEQWARFLFPRSASPLTLVSKTQSDPMARGPYAQMMMAREGGELKALLAAIDTNGDHRLSVAELARGDALFRLFDANDDEHISRDELQALLALASTSKFSQADPAEAAIPFEVIPPTSDKSALVRRLIDTFGKKGEKPGIPAECIAGGNKNGDGRIDEAELAAWLTHPQSQCDLSVELPASSLKEPRVKVLVVDPSARDWGVSVETPSPGQVLLRVGSNPLELRAAEPSRRVLRTTRYKAFFKRADQNQNGYIDASEVPFLGQGLGSIDFAAMDRDHDGKVFEEEWVAYLRLRDTLAESRLSLTIATDSIDPIAEFDANHDGRLDRAELGRLLAAIAAWDRNHDGFVTADEIPKTVVGTFHIGTLRTVSRARRYPGMKPPTTPKPQSEGPLWFQKMDRDHDGEVSLREFLGPLAVFRKLDANGDGRIDAKEAQAAQK
jgi:Ca2+-binding EF-hand superfamily protein